jgi:hypothetical protein
MMNAQKAIALVAVPFFSVALVVAACDDPAPTEKAPVNIGPTPTSTATGSPSSTATTPILSDGGTPTDDSGKPLDCVPDPKTNEEILNRCSAASERVSKTPVLPLKPQDGGPLPPVP